MQPIGKDIDKLSNLLRRQLDKNVSEDELSGTQGRILHYILGRPHLFQKDIETEFNLRSSSATGILKLMEKNGYIKRVPSEEDARLKEIIPTGKAEQHRDQVEYEIWSVEEQLIKGIDSQELEMFSDVLSRMLKNMGG